jgi:hypothetical protein|tara:strand:- start:161 stop:376 length:216 start_codon:yes stop_codon:yes gene_type:complete
MSHLLSFVSPVLRLFGDGAGMIQSGANNIAKMADKSPKASASIAGVGGVMAIAPEWLQEFFLWMSKIMGMM